MRRGRWRFKPSPTYGTPHPGGIDAVESAKFAMSIYDAAPPSIRDRAKNDCQSDIVWFYDRHSDPRPFAVRYDIPAGYTLPNFPWHDDPMSVFNSIFR